MAAQQHSTVGLDHASGYQRFIVGLAMRIALVTLGAGTATACYGLRHLVIDEGFTTCDAGNLVKASDLLRDLASSHGPRLDSVIIMSHLDAIRDAAHVHVPVTKGVAYSTVWYNGM
jgi:DNA repair exonuclease SbcCD ATPase subunit